MKSEEEILAEFWNSKVNGLKNVLRYGAPAFDITALYRALQKEGFSEEEVSLKPVRSFFGSECLSLQMNLCMPGDIVIIQNPGINTLDMNVQACREPVSLTGASIESVVGMIKTYIDFYPRYKEALDMRLNAFRTAGREEAKREKLKRLALSNIRLVIPPLFENSGYKPFLKVEDTYAVLAVRLKTGKTLEIKLPYADFQNSLPRIHEVIAQMEQNMRQCPLSVNISDTDYWNGEGFTLQGSPNK